MDDRTEIRGRDFRELRSRSTARPGRNETPHLNHPTHRALCCWRSARKSASRLDNRDTKDFM